VKPLVSISATPASASARCSTACAGSHDHQQGGRTTGPLPRGRRVYPRQSNRSLMSSRAAHRNIQTSLGVFRHLRERAVTGSASPFIPARFTGSNPRRAFVRNRACLPSCGYPLAHKQAVQRIAYGLHRHHQVLSSAVSVGIDPNENGLTFGTASLSPDDKSHD
jgi:hypothetical protein